MEQKPTVRMECKLKLVFLEFTQMPWYGVKHSLDVGLFDSVKFVFVFQLDFFTDCEKLIFYIFTSQNYRLPRAFEIAVVLSVRFDISELREPDIFVLRKATVIFGSVER